MKMKTLATGLIIALIGIGLMSGYNMASTTVAHPVIAYNTKSWDLNCTLTAGANVTFIFRENALWITHTYAFIDSDDDPPVQILPVFIDITPISPAGNTTEWDNDLAIYTPQSAGGVSTPRLIGWHLTKMNVTATPIDTSVLLNKEGNLIGVGGTVLFSGLYRAQLRTGMPADEPPSFLGFYSMDNVTTTAYPYRYLLPAGGATTVFGGAVLFLGARGLAVRRSHIRKQKNRTEIK